MEPYNDGVRLDTYDTDDSGKTLGWLSHSANPSVRYEVVELMDAEGGETKDIDLAIAGIVKIADEHFKVFTF